MPSRIIDGESVWMSRKVKSLPEHLRLHYVWWLPLAEANGTFELDPEMIRAKIYSFMLPEITVSFVKTTIKAFISAKLLDTWRAEGKTWGFFIGMEKKGRLVSSEHLKRYKNLPPTYPGLIRDGSGSMPRGFGIGLDRNGLERSAQISSSTKTDGDQDSQEED
jgi:hypothetical protein